MDPTTIQTLIEQNRQQQGQRIAQLPSIFQPPNYANDQQIATAQAQKNQKIQQLYEHDKMLADQYANPQSSLYMTDPYAREKALAIQDQGTAGEIGDINNTIQNRQQTLKDSSTTMQNYVQMLLSAGQQDTSTLQNELDNSLKLKQLQDQEAQQTGGSQAITNLLSSLLSINKQPGGADNSQAINTLLASTIASHPELANTAQSVVSLLAPQMAKFDYTADNVAAGVAGLPQTSQNTAALQSYMLKKTQTSNNSVETTPGGILGLGKTQYMVDKNTGKVTPLQTPGIGSGASGLLSGLWNFLTNGNGVSQTPATTTPSYSTFQPK